jgi:molecular chaperone GrpE (heat shock protein)
MFEKVAEDNKPPYAFCALDTKCELWKDGYSNGAEPREKRIAELEKENAELRKKNLSLQDAVDMQMYTNKANKEIADKQLTKAKVALRNVIDYLGQFCSDYPDCVIEAEQFLKDSEVKK